jgi:RNA polymerase sigma-70 factor, ECF subfamily
MTITDADLVRDALRGSERAFREIVERYERPVFSLIARIIRNPSRAEELAQDTFVKAFQQLDTYNRERKFANWLLTIAHNLGIDELRRTPLRMESLDDDQPGRAEIVDGRADTPAMAAERAELGRSLTAAIGRLRPEEAELVTLRYEQELTLQEIADITRLPTGTIKSSLHRARKKLAAALSCSGWRPPQ